MVYQTRNRGATGTSPAPDHAVLPGDARLRTLAFQAGGLVSGLSALAALGSLALAQAGGAASPVAAVLITLGLCVAGGAVIVLGIGKGHYPHARLGLCNVLTMTRGAGIAVLAGLVAVPGALTGPAALGWGLVALAGAVLTLDAADGWAARRAGLKSRFGARLDVEADVAFAIVLAVLAWQSGKVGIWFLALGGLRPAFLLAALVWPRLGAPLPEARWRKSVAAVQMVVQVVVLAPVVVPPLSTVIGAALLAGVVASFSVDVRWLLSSRGGDPAPGPDSPPERAR